LTETQLDVIHYKYQYGRNEERKGEISAHHNDKAGMNTKEKDKKRYPFLVQLEPNNIPKRGTSLI
jgi:hypothetical protein